LADPGLEPRAVMSKLPGVHVLVTGVTGFVGHHLTAALHSDGHRVSGLVRPSAPGSVPDGVATRAAEITDADAVAEAVHAESPDAIVHLAGASSVGASFGDPVGTWDVNLGGVIAILEAVRTAASPPRTLVITSGEIYGLVPAAALPVTEETPLRPVSPYGASKAAADIAAGQYRRAYGLPVVRVRPLNHIGPGQDARFVLPNVARQIAQAEHQGRDHVEIKIGNVASRRDFTDVRDVVRAYASLLTTGDPDGPYLLCSGRSIAIAELIDRLVAAARVDVRIVVDPALVRVGEQPDLFGDSRRLRTATGWAPAIDIEQTVADTLDWWRVQVAA
jgi:GDP-4-dehydro-6-deoxy-D-mannose reductase